MLAIEFLFIDIFLIIIMYLCFIALNAFACAINDDDNFNTQTEEDLQESLKKRAIMRKRVAIAARVIR